jgi:hypothetical protein
VRHYGYYLAPPELRGHVYNLLTSAMLLIAVAWLAFQLRGWFVIPAAWWVAEEGMVVGCTSIYLVRPWPLGGDQCSSLVGFDLSLIGAAVISAIALWLADKTY